MADESTFDSRNSSPVQLAMADESTFDSRNSPARAPESHKKSEKHKMTFFQIWCISCKMFVIFIEKGFEKIARFTTKRPFTVLFATLLIAVALTLGFLFIDVKNEVRNLYLPENSQASKDLKKAAKYGFEQDLRLEEIIILPKSKKDKHVLSRHCLTDLMDIHNAIVQLDGYEKYCFRSESSKKCVSINLLEIFEYNKSKLEHIPQRIHAVLKNTSYLMSNERRLRDNHFMIFGGQAPDNISETATSVLRIVYFMNEYASGENKEKIKNWESKFINKISDISKNMKCADVYYATARSLDDSLSQSTASDVILFAITFTIMGTFSSIVNGRCNDPLYGHQLLGMASLLAIFLGVTSAFGLSMFAGVPFVSIVGVLPFLIFSIGIDDVFIILHELNEIIRKNIPNADILTGCMTRSGPTITMTTLTDLVAFAVSSRSTFPAIRYFCVYAALGLTFAFILLVTFFVACTWFDIKRIKALRRDYLPFLRVSDASSSSTSCCVNSRRYFLDNAMRVYGRILMSIPGKTFVCLLSFLLLAGGIYGALNLDQGFSRQLLTAKGSHFQSFLNVYEEHFNHEVPVSVILPGPLDYSSSTIQQKYLDLEDIAKSNKHFTPTTLSWMSTFLNWAKVNNASTDEPKNFYPSLQRFLEHPEYRMFAQDVKFSENKKHISSSRILFFSKPSADSAVQTAMMTSIRDDLSEHSDLDVFPIALPFIYFEQYASVLDETIFNLITAGASILVVTSFFLIHPLVVFLLLLGFVSLILELFGLMYIWDVSLNSISMINLVMALGFSVDYSAHIAYHFVSSEAASPELRVVHALGTVGGSVLLGGLSTFLGMLVIAFSSSTIFQIFFKMFMGIIVFGLLHGLVMLPVYLSLFARLFSIRSPSYMGFLKRWRSRKRERPINENRKEQERGKLARKSSPVAIIGISCRFAQDVNSKDAFWNMLVEGKCGISSYPKNRLEAADMERFYNPGRNAPGKHYTLNGAYLNEISGFDAQFFGISTAECNALDPQQRLLLQVVYEAIEDAGLRLEDLQRSKTGVYVGLMNLDYGRLLLDNPNIQNIDEFASTGITASTVANRISFSLNLTGPSLTVDTACSSSLTALDIAITHLLTSQCEVAIVCAPNLILNRQSHTAFCRTGLLAEDGRCKSFDIEGDGYGRGEGIAAVVLKQTSLAILDRDDGYAEIVECGLNNDGQNAIPMTAPSDKMQAELGRRVLQESGLTKNDIQYVEAHGTGTAIGDVVEMRSVSDVYGNSSARVLRVGSVKSNINHTESTAGLAGMIKVCLMIKHGYFVPTINVQKLKPQLMIPERKMMVQVKHEPWRSENGKPRTAAICCYGYGGANAHAIVQEIMQLPTAVFPTQDRMHRIMTLSARSIEALKMMATRFAVWIEMKPDDDELLTDNICYTLNQRRTVHSHRLAVSFRSLKQAAQSMKMFADDNQGWQNFAAVGDTNKSVRKLVFLYGGQGTQWHGMAKEMMQFEPKFRESIKIIDSILKRIGVSWSLMEELTKSEEMSRIQENMIGQTALFALHYSMTELLKSWGISPTAVVGHSLGEISAACVVDAITLKDALKLVLHRARLQEKCSPTGRMAAIGMSAENAKDLVEKLHLGRRVGVAVINSPKDIVLSGDEEAMKVIQDHLQQHNSDVFFKMLATTRAFHSEEMEMIKREFMKGVQKINLRPRRATIPFYSTVLGMQVAGEKLSHDHWWKNVRQTVLFSSAMHAMMSDGYKHFVEINAAPQLPRYVRQIWTQHQKTKTAHESDAVVIATLPKTSVKDQHLSFLRNCPGSLFTTGYPISWDKIQGSGSKSFIRCPTYPWQEKLYWYREVEPPENVKLLGSTASSSDDGCGNHPLLGKAVSTDAFSGLLAWESEIDLYNLPYLKDHAFKNSDSSVIPGAFYVEMALAMISNMFPNVIPHLSHITFNKLLTLSTNDILIFRTRLEMITSHERESKYKIALVGQNGNDIVVSEGCANLVGVDETNSADPDTPNLERIHAIKSNLAKTPLKILEDERTKKGFNYGPQFSLLTELWCDDTEALCTLFLTEEILSSLASYVVHPSIIDACFQTLFLLKQEAENPVPHRIGDVIVQQRNFTESMFCHIMISGNKKEQTYDIVLINCHGNVVLLIKGFFIADMSHLRAESVLRDVGYEVNWEQTEQEQDVPIATEEKTWLVILDHLGFAKQFVDTLPKNQSITTLELTGTSHEIDRKSLRKFQDALAKLETGDRQQRLCVVNFLPVDSSTLEPDWMNFQQSNHLVFESSLLLLQAIAKKENVAKQVQFVLVTSDLVQLNSDTNATNATAPDRCQPVFPWSGTLLGFRRTTAAELIAPRTTLVDLPQNPSTSDFGQMLTDLMRPELHEEIAYRNGLRYLNQVNRLKDVESKPTKNLPFLCPAGDPRPFTLSFVSEKTFLRETIKSKQRDDQSEIEVSHAKPLLAVCWTAPHDKVAVCGKLTKNSSLSWTEGELALAVCEAHNLGNYILLENRSIVKIRSEEMNAQEAAALCFAMAFSFYILNELTRECKGKKILVYAENDEMACVFSSVAQSLGAIVSCVTKNTQNKSYMRQFGISVVAVDDELLIDREFENLTFSFACFLSKPRANTLQQVVKRIQEGGKVVTISNEKNGNFQVFVTKNVAFVNTSVDKIANDAVKFKELLSSCTHLLTSTGYLRKLKAWTHQSTSIFDTVSQDAARSISRSENGSGLVHRTITFNPKNAPKNVEFLRLALDRTGLRADRTYVVIGGIRGFGFEVVRWMVENGAKTVMCTARSPPDEEKEAEVASLEQDTKSRILLRQADVTSWEEMSSIKKELQELPDVAGIVFSAVVLDNQNIKDADLERCKGVIKTKVQGSIILHQLSLSMNLDFFIMFSSIAGVVGNFGQVAYSAANSFLDSLCEYRQRKLGLPALSVDWGTISGAGILERSKKTAQYLEKKGFHLIPCKKGLQFLKDFLIQYPDQTQVVLSDIDWPTFFSEDQANSVRISPRLQKIKEETSSLKQRDKFSTGYTMEDLVRLPSEERKKKVEEFVRHILSDYTEGVSDQVDLNLSLYKYGVDSISATDMSQKMRIGIGASFEVYYFVQPKTSGITIINDILGQIENLREEDKTEGETKDQQDVTSTDFANMNGTSPSSNREENLSGVELATYVAREEVVPLHVQDNALIKVFIMHSSTRLALANAPFAAGFQHQEFVSLYSIGIAEATLEKYDFESVQTMAKRYVKLIKAEQSTGPYYLAGFSFGGTLSIGVASQFTEQGDEVAMVVMLDTLPWFPEFLTHARQLNDIFQKLQTSDLNQTVKERFLSSIASSRLGYTQEEFQQLINGVGTEEQLLKAMKTRAEERNISLENLEDQISAIQHQNDGSSEAHNSWQPSKTHYHGTITYVRSQDKRIVTKVPKLWSGPASWKSLSGQMDLFAVPASHFQLLEQPYAELCGLVLMTTALFKYRTHYSTLQQADPRSRREERHIDWIKQTIDISMGEGALKLKAGKLVLSEDETVLMFWHDTCGLNRRQVINLTDIHNIVPGKYVYALWKNGLKKKDEDLIISVMATNNKLYHIRCLDWQQRDKLMEAFEALFGCPLLKFNYSF